MRQNSCYRLIGVVSVSLLTVAGSVFSTPAPEFKKNYFVGFGTNVFEFVSPQAEVSAADGSASGTGGQKPQHLMLGRDFTRKLTGELHFHRLQSDRTTGSVGLHRDVTLSALYYRSRKNGGGLAVYGRGGVGEITESALATGQRSTDSYLVAGVGLEFASRYGFAVRGEHWVRDNDTSNSYLSVLYRFNKFDDTPGLLSKNIDDPVEVPASSLTLVENFWCPDTIDFVVERTSCVLSDATKNTLRFALDSDHLSAEAISSLDRISNTLLEMPELKVTVTAHTDGTGSPDQNLSLSKLRVIATVGHLAKAGVALDRISAWAYGDQMPIATNETAEGRVRNRRVEMVLSQQ